VCTCEKISPKVAFASVELLKPGTVDGVARTFAP
jgi:hypothetical protein